jgi:hypothetical protein
MKTELRFWGFSLTGASWNQTNLVASRLARGQVGCHSRYRWRGQSGWSWPSKGTPSARRLAREEVCLDPAAVARPQHAGRHLDNPGKDRRIADRTDALCTMASVKPEILVASEHTRQRLALLRRKNLVVVALHFAKRYGPEIHRSDR